MSEPKSLQPVSAPRRFRWFQYRLRSLLILTTVVAALFAWWSHSARRQREAVAAIESDGASVTYVGFEDSFGRSDDYKPCPWPKCLVDLLGVDYFARVERVNFPSKHFTEAGFKHLTDLKIDSLYLFDMQITDTHLAYLQGMTTLRWLHLANTRITDSGLVHLKGLVTLDGLDLSETQVTDAGLARLKVLTKLHWLGLKETGVTDEGLEHLTGMKSLQRVDLSGTFVTDDGVARLKRAISNCEIVH